MQKQLYILNELSAIAHDMNELVERERDTEAQFQARREEARKKNQPVLPAMVADPQHLKPELGYFMQRLEAVRTYLGWDSRVL